MRSLLGPLALLLATPAFAGADAVRVRVLEQKHPVSVLVEAHSGGVQCDGVATTSWLTRLTVKGAQVELSDGSLCQRLHASDASLRLDGEPMRRYRGEIDVSVRGAELAIINDVPVEDYLRAVVPAELGKAGPAALAAQAVVSRSFALSSRGRHAKDNYDFCDLAHCQVYPGRTAEVAPATTAVDDTRGLVLVKEGKPVPAFFHANCGGATSGAEDVFGVHGPSAGVAETVAGGAPVCAGSADFRWKWEVPRAALAKALNLKPVGRAFEAVRRDTAGRVLELRAFGEPMSGPDFESKVGKAFGWLKLRSLKLNPIESATAVTFTGFGLGHGVGMCQQGARALAAHGQSGAQILEHYFPGATLEPATR